MSDLISRQQPVARGTNVLSNDAISRQAAIDEEGLDEEIRCEMCRNPMHTDRGCDGNCKYDEKLYEKIMQILDRRIKPLPSAQPDVPDTNVGDMISRQAAIDEAKEWIDAVYFEENDKRERKAIECFIGSLKNMPPAQPERTGKWIPVIERLPGKHGEMYLVTISDGSVYSCTLQWDANQKRWYLSFLNNGKILVDYIDDVIAWMPLPEPYREGGD